MEAFPADSGIPDEAADLRKPQLKGGERNGSTTRAATEEVARAVLEASTEQTAEHSDDVVAIAEALCERLGVSGAERKDVVTAARLHDIGKVAVPREILEKRGPLNASEWEVVRHHTLVGEQILRAVPEMTAAATLVRHSHERWDGGGYPDGLVGEEIPLGSRIIFCADAFHAMRCDRPYRPAVPATTALAEIAGCATSQFDPDVVAALRETAGVPPETAGVPPETATERQPERRRRFLPRFHRGRDTR